MNTQHFDFGQLNPGLERRGAVCLRRREEKQTREGKPYLVLEVGNASGSCKATVWSEGLAAWDGIKAGDALEIRARIKAGYRGGAPELEIVSLERLPSDHPVRLEVNPRCPVPRDELERRLDGLIDSMRRWEARHLLTLLLDERIGRERYFGAPAAVTHHHAYIGGLAEHSIEVAEFAVAIAATEPYSGLVDRDAIIVAALLHDIGKIDEYQWAGVPIAVSRLGRLRSHVSRGPEIIAQMVSDSWAMAGGTVSELDVRHLQHVMESHHGQTEWGSPVPPGTLEATIVHHADRVSARLRGHGG